MHYNDELCHVLLCYGTGLLKANPINSDGELKENIVKCFLESRGSN